MVDVSSSFSSCLPTLAIFYFFMSCHPNSSEVNRVPFCKAIVISSHCSSIASNESDYGIDPSFGQRSVFSLILEEWSKVGQDASAFDLLRAVRPWPVAGEEHKWAAKAGHACCCICFGWKMPSRDQGALQEARSPLRPLSNFRVPSPFDSNRSSLK